MKRVLLWNIPEELLLIVEHPSGVVYQNQVGGVTCGQAELQGVLAPLDASAEAVHRIESCPYPAARDGISAEIADTIDQVLAAEPALHFLKVDRARLDECLEAWVHVKIDSPESDVPTLQGPYFGPVYGFGSVKGVLTWPNSD